jgi:hypothetical protein
MPQLPLIQIRLVWISPWPQWLPFSYHFLNWGHSHSSNWIGHLWFHPYSTHIALRRPCWHQVTISSLWMFSLKTRPSIIGRWRKCYSLAPANHREAFSSCIKLNATLKCVMQQFCFWSVCHIENKWNLPEIKSDNSPPRFGTFFPCVSRTATQHCKASIEWKVRV